MKFKNKISTFWVEKTYCYIKTNYTGFYLYNAWKLKNKSTLKFQQNSFATETSIEIEIEIETLFFLLKYQIYILEHHFENRKKIFKFLISEFRLSIN